jgi:tRNA-Thr(GGU) m(6)t(6)A37 methyltransferase TsaA
VKKHAEFLKDVVLHPIGLIHSPLKKKEEAPIQPVYAQGIKGSVEIFDEYSDGLRDLEGFSHIYLFYHFHRAGDTRLLVKPFLDDLPRGVFATRAPCRPNPIGLSLVRLNRIKGNVLHIEDLDILDGTPLLDIKPYISRFNPREKVRSGWQEKVDEKTARILGRRESHQKQTKET